MNGGPITTVAEWRTKSGQLEEVLKLLAEVVQKSREENGNLFYTVYQSYNDPNTLFLIEGYKDESALDAHRNSDYFQRIVIGKIVPLLDNRAVSQVRTLDYKGDT
ncbi:putative quinol monooxygenase [Fibrisoma limi]|uniref:putative quinol monooxygenase n=1 Tax=Fibrisoma limi TaxID=663275 RepID=UPI000587CB42|nr:putative quinol monooxygenase [Fibrisoma limi]